MVDSDSWTEYKKLILNRLKDLKQAEEDIVEIKIKLAVLTTKVVIITTAVALGTSGIVTAIANHFLKGGA